MAHDATRLNLKPTFSNKSREKARSSNVSGLCQRPPRLDHSRPAEPRKGIRSITLNLMMKMRKGTMQRTLLRLIRARSLHWIDHLDLRGGATDLLWRLHKSLGMLLEMLSKVILHRIFQKRSKAARSVSTCFSGLEFLATGKVSLPCFSICCHGKFKR
jgi:hypothetical protein